MMTPRSCGIPTFVLYGTAAFRLATRHRKDATATVPGLHRFNSSSSGVHLEISDSIGCLTQGCRAKGPLQ